MGGQKLAPSLTVQTEHRQYRSAKSSPSLTVSAWDPKYVSPVPRPPEFRWFGGLRHFAIYVMCLLKSALLSYKFRDKQNHFHFTLINEAVVNASYTLTPDPKFKVFYTGNVDAVYVRKNMYLELTLDQTTSFVANFSTLEGILCYKCNDPANELPTFKHVTHISPSTTYVNAIEKLRDIMHTFNEKLISAGCNISPKSLRIEALIEKSNIWAGDPCLRLGIDKSSSSSSSDKNSDTSLPYMKKIVKFTSSDTVSSTGEVIIASPVRRFWLAGRIPLPKGETEKEEAVSTPSPSSVEEGMHIDERETPFNSVVVSDPADIEVQNITENIAQPPIATKPMAPSSDESEQRSILEKDLEMSDDSDIDDWGPECIHDHSRPGCRPIYPDCNHEPVYARPPSATSDKGEFTQDSAPMPPPSPGFLASLPVGLNIPAKSKKSEKHISIAVEPAKKPKHPQSMEYYTTDAA